MKENQFETLKQLYKIKRLETTDKIESFDCGNDYLNDFILNQSALFRKEKLAISYAVQNKTNPREVVAFFSLSNDKIAITDFENKNKYNRFSRRFLTVDAYCDAIPFYYKNGFVPLNDADLHDRTRLLYYDLNDVD